MLHPTRTVICAIVVALAVAVPASAATHRVTIGEPAPSHTVTIAGRRGTLELRAENPVRASGAHLFAALVNGSRYEAPTTCFAIYDNGMPRYTGDVDCVSRHTGPLTGSVGRLASRRRSHVWRAAYIVGQVLPDVTHLEIIGRGWKRSLPISRLRMFLAAFPSTARGSVRLVVEESDGHTVTRSFKLPASSPGSRQGTISNGEVGENVLDLSYSQLVHNFGPPRQTVAGQGGERCLYYSVVGQSTGWLFCFKGARMLSASGNQRPPRRAK
jgi:hypothetical protein